jgi:hypothetical protein
MYCIIKNHSENMGEGCDGRGHVLIRRYLFVVPTSVQVLEYRDVLPKQRRSFV